ncbi:MAG: DUF4384 domain-containing protein [Bryobacteraceae bacterium]|nr:DUF4384 domain-containing protein [Bryobacteraceae bacterium]
MGLPGLTAAGWLLLLAGWAAPPPGSAVRPGTPPTEPAPVRGGLDARPAAAAKRIEIIVERNERGAARRVDPNQVFATGDLVRFRFRATFNGYLYVMNHGTTGSFTLLFPKEETGTMNRIEAGREYLVPMTENGWFRLEGPPGYEVVYWLVSPVRLSDGRSALPVPKLPAAAPALNPSITPRCDDTIFRARGECIDHAAGLKPVEKDAALPENLAPFSGAASRELTFVKSNRTAAVSVSDASEEPFIYTLRLAHR